MAKRGKEKILAKAFLLFLEHGYKHVSIQNIQDDTMLSKGAIYYHFKSKYAIYQAAVEEYFLKIVDDFSKTNDAHLGFKLRILHRLGDLAKLFSLIEHIGTERKAYAIRAFFVFQLESEKDDTIRERTSQGLESYRKEMIAVVQDGIDSGEVKVHLEATIIAHQLISMAEGIAVHNSIVKYDCETFLNEQIKLLIGPYLDLITMELGTPESQQELSNHNHS